jgi:hypothetical protein
VKFFHDFERTGEGFAERVGDPDEFHDAMGRIALNFSDLENTASIVIVLLSGTEPEVGHILAAELSFRQKIDVLASLARRRSAVLTNLSVRPIDDNEYVTDIVRMCRQAEELRNTYLHSSYGDRRRERAKLSAKAKHGLRVHREQVDAGVLLDVADYIAMVAAELEGMPMNFDIADSVSGGGDTVTFSKDGHLVATFKGGKVSFTS